MYGLGCRKIGFPLQSSTSLLRRRSLRVGCESGALKYREASRSVSGATLNPKP